MGQTSNGNNRHRATMHDAARGEDDFAGLQTCAPTFVAIVAPVVLRGRGLTLSIS